MITAERYSSVAIILHWVMAISFIAMIAMGLIMTDLNDKALKFNMYQWHKSLGVLLLITFGAVPDNVEICYKDQHEEEQIKQVITI